MTFLTTNNYELFYSMPPAAGQTQATFTTAALVTPSTTSSGGPVCKMPDPYTTWQGNIVGKSFRVVGRGSWGDTSAAPTFKMQLGFDTTQGTLAANYAGTGAVTCPTASVTNGAGGGSWLFEADITWSAISMNAAGVYSYSAYVTGEFSLNSPTASAGGGITGSAQPITGLLSSSTYFLELWATCGTSNGSNAITCTHFKVYGEN